ncbi:MoaD/ThiS family protein [Membranihabitans marinus]|uniref:MoaD/ThiS family protein n=1 Tax=Membranihabitans marinus TaxID=1227546 RepID=UPI001F3753AE|nr:MoaD/ThiS family protein [Membranihabitans marinus]
MITIKYFGPMADLTARDEETISLLMLNVLELYDWLMETYKLESIPFSIAVNNEIVPVTSDVALQENDEIAVLPPYAGG